MTSLLIRDLDRTVKQRLRERAAARGHSMAEEARQILRDSLVPAAANPAVLARDLFGPAHGIELDLPAREQDRAAPDFGPDFGPGSGV
jgi:plasmid stability protein